jgi:hypothetical protein
MWGCRAGRRSCQSTHTAGVWIRFSINSPNWRVVQYFHSPSQKQLAKSIKRVSERKKNLTRLASGFAFVLANHEFYSHLASWRVVIRTPTYCLVFGVGVCFFCWNHWLILSMIAVNAFEAACCEYNSHVYYCSDTTMLCMCHGIIRLMFIIVVTKQCFVCAME